MLSNYEAARARYEEARPIYAAIGHRVGQANVAYNIAQILIRTGEAAAAETFLVEAVAIGKAILPGHPFTTKMIEELAALRAELAGR